MTLQRVRIGLLSRADGLDEIFLMRFIGEVALVFSHELVVLFKDLPAAAVTAQIHHALGSVNLGATPILRPERPLFPVTHFGSSFFQVFRGAAALECQYEIAVV